MSQYALEMRRTIRLLEILQVSAVRSCSFLKFNNKYPKMAKMNSHYASCLSSDELR